MAQGAKYIEQTIEINTPKLLESPKKGVDGKWETGNHSDDEHNTSETCLKTAYSPQASAEPALSQIPNQDFYIVLDNALNNKPRELYISKIELCRSDANLISWYRSTLASRAQSLTECPNGVLKSRRKTAKSSVEQKLATDCYILAMFIDGDDSNEIETVFNRYRSESCTVETSDCKLENSESKVIDLAELFSSVHHLRSELAAIKEARTTDISRMQQLQIEVNDLKKRNNDLSMTLQRIEHDVTSTKATITAIRRENSETLKSLECQSCIDSASKVIKITRDVNRISSTLRSIINKKEPNTNGSTGRKSKDTDEQSIDVAVSDYFGPYENIQIRSNDRTVVRNRSDQTESVGSLLTHSESNAVHEQGTSQTSSSEHLTKESSVDRGSYADVTRSAPISTANTFAPLSNCQNLLSNGRLFRRPDPHFQPPPISEDGDVEILSFEPGADLSRRSMDTIVETVSVSLGNRRTPMRNSVAENLHIVTEKPSAQKSKLN